MPGSAPLGVRIGNLCAVCHFGPPKGFAVISFALLKRQADCDRALFTVISTERFILSFRPSVASGEIYPPDLPLVISYRNLTISYNKREWLACQSIKCYLWTAIHHPNLKTMHLKKGAVLEGGKYRIERLLGQGGFGITYLAVQSGLERKVAIKEFFMKDLCNRDAETFQVSVPSSGSQELVDKFKKKFLKEAQMISEYKHPNIVNIHDVFEENGTAYYVMSYLECGSLASLALPLSYDMAIGYIRQIASALSYIHRRNTIHLDVKPANVLIDRDGNAVLIDFGISKRYDGHGGQTSTTPVGVSNGYAPIEQYSQLVNRFTPATDIYSLGATLYKLLTGITPPESSLLVCDPDMLDTSSLSDSIAGLIKKCLSPNMAGRPQDIDSFLDLLDEAVGKSSVRNSKKKSRNLRWWMLIVVLLLCDAGALIYFKSNPESSIAAVKEVRESVDLGLSVKWATCNVGASAQDEKGNYLSWEEASETNWGDGWRIPTMEECRELIDECTWTGTVQNGVTGYIVTGPNGNSIFLPFCGFRYGNAIVHPDASSNYWTSTFYDESLDFVYVLYVSKYADVSCQEYRYIHDELFNVRLVKE